MAKIISIRTVAFKDWVLYLQDNTAIYRLPVGPFPQGSPQGLGCAAVQQIQCVLQPWEMERGLRGCQGVSPVGSDLHKGRLTEHCRCCLLPFLGVCFVFILPSLMFIFFVVGCESMWDLGSPTRNRTRTPCIESWAP